MNLPEELLDEILGHLPSDEGRSLRSCSLVSKYWLRPSRRLLFAQIRIRLDNYKSWLEKIPATNTGLLFQVRSLTYFLRGAGVGTPKFASIYIFRDYLSSFCQLQSLTLCHLCIEPTFLERLDLFSAFQHTLSSLSLGVVSVAWNSFVALVGYFPKLRSLNLLATSFQVDNKPAPRISHPGRGKLFVDLITNAAVGFPHNRFAELRPGYEELEILGGYEHRLVAAVEQTLKSLKINRCHPDSSPDLSRCPELRQITIGVAQPEEKELALISSITSTNLQRLVFVSHLDFADSDLVHPCWTPFDEMICELVDRLQWSGQKHTLEVELRTNRVDTSAKAPHKKFLPKFKGKGRVRIVETSNGRVSEWP